jgi:DNA-directed RNA polymerase subunit beta'
VSNRIFDRFREYIHTAQFNAIKIGIASPEQIRSKSYGEVKKIETINYRTLKPEKDGLFCARIFGPQKDWECNCGKYRRMKHRGVTCEKCGVEVIQARVRRERMGHISLVSPVGHIWFLKGIPSYLSLILDMTVRDIEKVAYFDSYIVLQQGQSPYPVRTLLSSQEYEEYTEARPDDMDFKADMGAEALRKILAQKDLAFEVRKIEEMYKQANALTVKHRLAKRFRVLSGLMQANMRPEWMILDVLPVLPPDLRPLVPLPGGRFASSDLNDLYRRVLNRNIRLRRLIELEAPGVIIKNEKRMLQEAVDSLIDNGRRGHPVRGTNRRALKSLSEMLRGKQGRFRQNLLGKRVDYSGRSVIVVDPKLKMSECGLPKLMALELFKPYVYAELQRRELAPNLRVAKRMVENMDADVWSALEEVVKDRPVLLNRAPTLHRLGIQAFYPNLVEGKAIKIHPLVCAAFNADFDGDQMAVHLPLSTRSQSEARSLMLSTRNIIASSSGKPVALPSKEMVLGLYYLTKGRKNVAGDGIAFADKEEVVFAYNQKKVHLQAQIALRLPGNVMVKTTVGRVLLFDALPSAVKFEWINKAMTNRDIGKLISRLHRFAGIEPTVEALDRIKTLGFNTATQGGISLSMDDLVVPQAKQVILDDSRKSVDQIEKLYRDGAITNGERRNNVIQVWARATEDVARSMMKELEENDAASVENVDKLSKPFNPVFLILASGARNLKSQVKQLGGIRGLMNNPSGDIIETPVLANFKEGLNPFEYFISTHGARKGLADTALKTADAGYLTRRLVDVAQDVVITTDDCKTLGYITIEALERGGKMLKTLEERVFGRVAAEDWRDPVTHELIVSEGEFVTHEVVDKLRDSALTSVSARSVLTCQASKGVCVKCYGLDLSTAQIVDIGAAVGIVAAQSIGEPGTQLTLRTFHIGGTASGLVEQTASVAHFAGKVMYQDMHLVKREDGSRVVMNRKARLLIVSNDGRELERFRIEYGSVILVDDEAMVQVGAKLAQCEPQRVIMTEHPGRVEYIDLIENITYHDQFEELTGQSRRFILERREEKRQPCLAILDDNDEVIARYFLPTGANILSHHGDRVAQGQIIAKMPQQETKSKDITGGLARVVELFEARLPKDLAVLSDADGKIEFGGIHRGQRRITVTTDDGEVFEYNISRSKHLNVEDGEYVKAGDVLTDGLPAPHDILRILGPDELQRYLVGGVQEVYSDQGQTIDDKHVETIVRQMLKKVRIVDPGDTSFVVGDRVDRHHLQAVNALLAHDGRKIAIARPMLMGITKASLETDSFLAAASFQETTRVLTEAAVMGQVDYLTCLKSNIIIGRMIPAGTGISSFRQKYIGDNRSDLERRAAEEELLEVGLDKISLPTGV